MRSRERVPGIEADGVVLSTQPQVKPTHTTVIFQSCSIGIFCILDADNICVGYQVNIQDPIFNSEYKMLIDNQEVWDSLIAGLPEMPKIGNKPSEELLPDA